MSILDELKKKSDYDFDLPKINGVHQLTVKLSDIEEVLSKVTCENCILINKTRTAVEGALGYCPIIKHTIQNIKFGCMSWESKEVKNE